MAAATAALITQGLELLEEPMRWLEASVGAEPAACLLRALAAFLSLPASEAGGLLLPSESPELHPLSISGPPFSPLVLSFPTP